MRLCTQIEKIFGTNLLLATLFQAPTVEQLASILVRHTAGKAERQDIDRLLAAVEGMSEDEARSHLHQEMPPRRE